MYGKLVISMCALMSLEINVNITTNTTDETVFASYINHSSTLLMNTPNKFYKAINWKWTFPEIGEGTLQQP